MSELIRHNRNAGLIYCATCREMRPETEFLDLEYQVGSGGLAGGAADVDPIACSRCRHVGPPPLDPLSTLTGAEVRAIEAIAAGHTLTDASKASGIPYKRLSAMLRTRESTDFRRAWQRLLESKGLDMNKIAEKAADLLEAKDHKYHPDAKEFAEFPDNKTQAAMVRWLASQHGTDPPKETGEKGGSAVQVVFNTNLGENADGRALDVDYIVRPVEKQVEQLDG